MAAKAKPKKMSSKQMKKTKSALVPAAEIRIALPDRGPTTSVSKMVV